MSQSATHQVIQVQNTLKAKVGGKFSIDAGAIAKAEAALADLSSNFDDWLNEEIEKLDQARALIKAEGLTDKTVEILYFRAHDLKGLGTTYGYPLVSRIAGSLCKLIDEDDKRLKAPLLLIDAHIDAIKVIVREKVKKEGIDATAGNLVKALEVNVDEFLKSLD